MACAATAIDLFGEGEGEDDLTQADAARDMASAAGTALAMADTAAQRGGRRCCGVTARRAPQCPVKAEDAVLQQEPSQRARSLPTPREPGLEKARNHKMEP